MSSKIKRREKMQSPAKLVATGRALLEQGQYSKAEKAWRQAAEIDAEATSRCLFEAAQACALQKFHPQARELLKKTIALNPAQPLLIQALLLSAKIDNADGEWLDAIASTTRILQLDPNHIEAVEIRQVCYFMVGYAQEDVDDFRRLLELKPGPWHSRLMFKLNFLSATTPESLFEENKRWSQLYAEPLASAILPHANSREALRRLKIGYVSPDFRFHALMRLLQGVLENHDKSQFEIFAYSINTQRDEMTEMAQRLVDHFVELPASTAALVQRVRQDQIDILVDLAGHTMPVETLLAFAVKPAPIQISWMGNLATTGLPTMDYFMGDAYLPCPGTEHLFSEKVYRLPRIHACYRPPTDAGIVTPPYFRNGYITFGSFNDIRKITREVVQVWSLILHLHPGSKLLFKYYKLEREIVQRRLREWFQADGISSDRLEFEGAGWLIQFQETINKVDIALDPFPYGGGTTTLSTLWMGVPVVSLAGRLAVARSGACLLSVVGLPVATTVEEYVSLAIIMAKSIPDQPHSRAGLRNNMIRSQLMDEKGMTRSMEAAYRDIWGKWCAENQ